MFDCVFCKIVSKEIQASVITETENILVIKDINPKATVHYLIIPKKHFPDLNSYQGDNLLLGELLLIPKKLALEFNIPAFKLVVNNGKAAGQCVFHFHIHFLSGKFDKLSDL